MQIKEENMQIFKLIKPGVVDSVIGFDALPESLLTGIRRGPINGWPRAWYEFLKVDRANTAANPFYVLDYITRNADKEKWQEVSSFVKRNVDPATRLLDKIEAMAKPVAIDAHSDLNLEPEDVPMIPFPKAAEGDESDAKRLGRPRKSESVTA